MRAGKEVARVDTRWTLVDTETTKIIRAIPEDMEKHWNEQVDWELSQTVPKAAELTAAGVRRAGYTICDTNRHINNAALLDVVCDALPQQVIEQGPMQYGVIKYHRQVPFGEQMDLFYGSGPGAGGLRLVCNRAQGRQSSL